MNETFTDDKNGKLIGDQGTTFDINKLKKGAPWVLVDRVISNITEIVYATYLNTVTRDIVQFDEKSKAFVVVIRGKEWIYTSEAIDQMMRQTLEGS